MPRIPFADLTSTGNRRLVEQIIEKRGSVLDVYKMLLHSPPLAKGWLCYLNAIREECKLPADIRELVIMRIAVLNRASYEAEQHKSFAKHAGISEDQMTQLAHWPSSSCFNARQRAALDYTDAMTKEIQVPKSVFTSVLEHFGDRLLVELTATVAAYNMVSRFLEALEIHANFNK